MNTRPLLLLFLFTVLAGLGQVKAQREIDESAMIFDHEGLQFGHVDSSFLVNFRFRMQNRLAAYTYSGEDLGIREFEARVRRLRLRMDGFVLNPKLSYSIQLSFSRGDQDSEDTGVANIIRDAVIFYSFTPKFYMSFGLNKLPGNRQRVNSSGQLQFADRSIVNAAMNIDRDFGIKAYYSDDIGKVAYRLKGAVTTGEGRAANSTDNGLAYTGRLEILPMGAFTGEGDYSEGDLEREPKPKLSLAGGYSFNNKTTRTGGQTGTYLYAPVDMGTLILDGIFKYRGWAYAMEYLKRTVDHPLTYNEEGDLQYAFTGEGVNSQLSYLFKSNYEIAGRYSWLSPAHKIREQENVTKVIELGLSKYLIQHRVKVQFNLNYTDRDGDFDFSEDNGNWGGIFQFEFGI